MRNDHDQLLEIMTKAVEAVKTEEEKMIALSEARYRFIASRAMRANKEIINEFRSARTDPGRHQEHGEDLLCRAEAETVNGHDKK